MSGRQNESAFERLMEQELGDLDVARAWQLADAAKAKQKLFEDADGKRKKWLEHQAKTSTCANGVKDRNTADAVKAEWLAAKASLPSSATSGTAKLPADSDDKQWLAVVEKAKNAANELSAKARSSKRETEAEVVDAGPFTDEPVVASVDTDLFGIALSGGGIRSATFNLGLLQGLENRGLLTNLDYLSTVSGGGYVGGFYSALRATSKVRSSPGGAPKLNEPDSPPVRHLREFSSFLVPRYGLFQAETHRALAHAVRVMAVSLTGSLSLLICAACTWLIFIVFCATHPWFAPFATVELLIISACLTAIATGWQREETRATGSRPWRDVLTHPLFWHLGLSLLVLVLAGVVLLSGYPLPLVNEYPRGPSAIEIDYDSARRMRDALLTPATHTLFPYLAPLAFLALPYAVVLLLRSWFGLLALCGQRCTPETLRRRRVAANLATGLITSAAILWLFCLVPWKLGVVFAANGIEVLSAVVALLAALFEVSRRFVPAVGDRTRATSSLKLRALGRLPGVLASGVLLGAATMVATGLVMLHWAQPLGTPLSQAENLRAALDGARGAFMYVVAAVGAVALVALLVASKPRRRLWGTAMLQSGLIAVVANSACVGIACALVLITPVAILTRGIAHCRYFIRAAALLGGVVLALQSAPYLLALPLVAVVLALFTCLLACFVCLFSPKKTSFFSFYRERIVRTYLGARHTEDCVAGSLNRATNEQEKDDLALDDLPERPLHLICVAANDLGNDRLSNLSRGASSAVLSRNGLAVGNRWFDTGQLQGITLGEALTASGAAFNSNMGSASVQFGLACGVLMTALNLRLGLWVRPSDRTRGAQERGRSYFGGWFFFKEMFQHTFSTFASKRSPTYHLSDGGHFENLGLYELLRRHCSYIIVSDAGADPNLSFADIGNALQLAREDFGIEVDIDFSALRPDDDGLSKVRVAVGRILYPAGKLGVLIYVKPVLTGDEPEDIRQYRSESRTFPHEGTADQFYDRAQWECYRKLGAHTVRRVFGFVDPSRNDTLEWIFQSAFATWSPMPGPLYKRTIEANDDYSGLITGLGQSEVAATTLLGHHLADKCPGRSADTPSAQDVVDCLNLIQTIEHVWVTCQLDDYLFHRAASGWFDFIERAASGPQFRQLWPLLRWQFSREFGGFMEKRFFWLDSDKPSGQTAITIDVECCLKKNDRAAKRFAGAHPRRPPSASAEAYADSYQLWLRVGGVERFVPDTILAATPEIGRWTVTDIESDKRRLLDLCELLVLPGAGGLSTAASFLAKLNNKVGGRIEGPGGTLSWALIIRSTPDQQQSTTVPAASRPARLLTRSGSETEAASVIHRRAVPFIEARLGTLKFFRETEKHLLTENTRKNRGTGTLVGVVLVD